MPPDAITMLPVPGVCRTSGFELGRLIKALFSFRVMLAAGLVLIYLLTISNRFSDPDLWFHLKLGQTMWDNHSIPSTDSFSYTAYGHTYPDSVEDLRNHAPIVIDLPGYGRHITTFETGTAVSRWETN
jgi:hypothetical protein